MRGRIAHVTVARVFIPVSKDALSRLASGGVLGTGDGYQADPDDEDATYDAMAAATQASDERLVVEADAEGDSVTLDAVVALYLDESWYGVQEIGSLLA